MAVNFALYNSVTYTLSTNPEFPLETSRNDIFINKIEAGYPYTRPRYTRILRQWKLQYRYLISSDVTNLNTLFNATKYNDIFTWYNPEDLNTYIVRLFTIPTLKYFQYGYWAIDITLEEV